MPDHRIPLHCPLCHLPLTPHDKSVSCAARHSFDRAREGYLNLLTVQQKNSLNPGDDARMVAARRAFLEAGHYRPLLDAMLELLAQLKPDTLLDSGCGEGWYSCQLASAARHTAAFDISKDAVKRAAKRSPDIEWLVASSHDIPLPDASISAITAIFSPIKAEEASRVLHNAGHLLIAAPGEKHLWELREALYPEVRAHQAEKWIGGLSEHFRLVQERSVAFPLQLTDNGTLQQLLYMTPHYWRAARERRTQVESLPTFQTQADFRLFVFQKNTTSPAATTSS